MGVKWNTGDYNPGFLAKRLEGLKTKDNADRIGFKGFATQDILAVIDSSIEFSEPLPEVEKRRIIWSSIISAAKGRLSDKTILAEILKGEREFVQRPRKPFVLATSLSVTRFTPLKGTEISGCRMRFDASLPRRFDREKIKDTVRHHIVGDLPSSYTTVRTSVRARSEYEAAEAALDAIDLLRGIWNLFFNRQTGIRMSSGRQRPVNSILLGPLHTLHEPNGKPALELFWYDPEYVEPVQCKDLHQSWGKLQKFERTVRKKLVGHHYRSDMEEAIRRYVRALDSRDWNSSFLRLWSLLEFLTATERADYKQTIRRVLFLYKEGEFHEQILNHLRNYRNRTVHTGDETQEIETLLHQLRQYVECLLEFHLANRLGFSRLTETAEFLHQPTDLPFLQKRLLMTKRAIRFLSD